MLDRPLDDPRRADREVGQDRQAGEQEDGQRDSQQDEIRVASQRSEAAALGAARGL
jgi:hypothetical protein